MEIKTIVYGVIGTNKDSILALKRNARNILIEENIDLQIIAINKLEDLKGIKFDIFYFSELSNNIKYINEIRKEIEIRSVKPYFDFMKHV